MLEKNIVLFDMDNTLVSEDTGDLWGQFLDEKGLVNESEKKTREKLNGDYKNGQLDPIENFHFEISLLKKIPNQLKAQFQQEFFEYIVKPHISKTGLSLIEEYKDNADTIVILITATLSYIASPVAEYSKVHDLIATEAESKGGDFTGKIFGTACLQEGKVIRFKSWMENNHITPLHTILYTDSINDLPLLNYVKEPIVVDPDKYLSQIAKEKSWKMMSLK